VNPSLHEQEDDQPTAWSLVKLYIAQQGDRLRAEHDMFNMFNLCVRYLVIDMVIRHA
jgi:hypothetical protein